MEKNDYNTTTQTCIKFYLTYAMKKTVIRTVRKQQAIIRFGGNHIDLVS